MRTILDAFREVFGPILLILFVAIALITACMRGVAEYDCHNFGNLIELETKVVTLDCYVKMDSGWVSKDRYELFQLFKR